jgi:SNF2 family DNA or RNA helicase
MLSATPINNSSDDLFNLFRILDESLFPYKSEFPRLIRQNGPIVKVRDALMSGQLSNREEIIATLQKMSQPDPQQAQMEHANMQLEMMGKQALIEKTKADTIKSTAEAEKATVETQLAPQKAQAQIVSDLSKGNNPTDQVQQEFDRRVKIAELMLKEADLKQNSKIVEMQMAEKNSRIQKTNAEFLKTLSSKL